MAMKKSKTTKRAKKRSPVKDLTPKSASSVKGGATWTDITLNRGTTPKPLS